MEKKYSLLTLIIVAIAAAALGSAATLYIPKYMTRSNVAGSWYSSYAGKTFVITLKSDGTFEYGYEDSEQTTGKYSNTSEVLTLTSDAGENNLVYKLGKNYIEISSEKYYDSKEAATENDSYYFVPDDYDTSMFTNITASDTITKFKNGDEVFVLTARGSCGYCQLFRPIAAESVEKYNYTLYYLDITSIKDEEFSTFFGLDEKFEVLGSTPTIFYFKGGKIVDTLQGAASAEELGNFLESHGVKAK